jgi:predicted secreted hydrolase
MRSSIRARLMTLCIASLVTFLACVALAGAGTLQPVRLPRDHGAHAGFSVEWWYTTGHANGAHGRRYFWFATIWATPQSAVGRVNVVDLERDRVVLAKQWVRAAPIAAGARDFDVGGLRLRWLASGRLGRVTVDARVDRAESLRLELVPKRPYVLHGDHGIVQQGASGTSAYYSATRLRATGTLRTTGRPRRLSGLAWFDHQWGDFAAVPGALRWDWFACQLDDGRDVMVAQFLGADDRPLPGVGGGTLVSAHGRAMPVQRFAATPVGSAIRPAGATAVYPLKWRLKVPQAGLDLRLRAVARHQFITMQFLPSFWEGEAAIVRGAPGVCTVENSREAPVG